MAALNSLVGLTGKYINRQPYIGYYGGATVMIPVSDQFSVEPGLFYSQTGSSLRGELGIKRMDILSINAQANIIQQSIEIPLMIKANIGGGFEVMAGPPGKLPVEKQITGKCFRGGF